MNSHECLKTLDRHIQSRNASSFFLNGSVGSGKSYLLQKLLQDLVRIPLRIQAIGPIGVDHSSLKDLGYAILSDCHETGFLDGPFSSVPRLDFIESWQWLESNAVVNGDQRFILLLDLSSPVQSDVSATGDLFSKIRFLEGVWDNRFVQPHIIVAGCWDHVQLKVHYDSLNVSFPYTDGYNYARWSGVLVDDMVKIVAKSGGASENRILGTVLHELVGGHPGAAMDVLSCSKRLDLRNLLAATTEAALNGEQSRRFVEQWQGFSQNIRTLVSDLLVRRHIVVSPAFDVVDSLVTAGMTRLDQIGNRSVLSFSSWYVELVVRLHAVDLGVSDDVIDKISLQELMPEVSTFSEAAYRLINNIENQARNFIVTQLCVQQASTEALHVLQGISSKYDDRAGRTLDVYERSIIWKARSQRAGLPVDLNPLIAYCSTRDLAWIIDELAHEIGSTSWSLVAKAIDELSGIRDAVMHNQLIDLDELNRLFELQTAILDAVSETSR